MQLLENGDNMKLFFANGSLGLQYINVMSTRPRRIILSCNRGFIWTLISGQQREGVSEIKAHKKKKNILSLVISLKV